MAARMGASSLSPLTSVYTEVSIYLVIYMERSLRYFEYENES